MVLLGIQEEDKFGIERATGQCYNVKELGDLVPGRTKKTRKRR